MRKVTIFYRNSFVGGDGWTYYPLNVSIADHCPQCGGERGTPKPYRFCEDGEWYNVDRWENACGHVDTYKDCFFESRGLQFDNGRIIAPNA